MQNVLVQFAEAEGEVSGDLFGILGIDWTALLLQIISFAILVFIIAKFIYPQIVAMLDRHDKKIEDSLKAAEEAKAQADKTEAESAAILEKSRNEAAEIVEVAKRESAEIIAKAEKDAAARADAMITEAHANIDRDTQQAREALKNEMVELVGLATEKIIDTKISKNDEKVISATLKEVADGR